MGQAISQRLRLVIRNLLSNNPYTVIARCHTGKDAGIHLQGRKPSVVMDADILAGMTAKFRSSRGAFGFTLIEVLVVLFIVGIVSGAAVLGVGYFSERNSAKNVAERLYHILPLVREYAVLHGQVISFQIEENGYAFYYLKNKDQTEDTWELITKPSFLAPQHLSRNISLTLNPIHTKNNHFDDENKMLTSIEISPTMEIQPFILTIGTMDVPSQYELSVQKNGTIELKGP